MVPVSQTEWINPYILGSVATADVCEINQIECIYDDSFSSGSNPKFFEPGSDVAFYFTKDPKDVENWQNADYAESDVRKKIKEIKLIIYFS